MSSLSRIAPALALAWLASVAAGPAGGDRKELVLRGVALDREGRSVPGARVLVTGDLDASTLTDSAGRFALRLQIGTAGELRSHPVRLVMDAKARGKRLRIAGGPERLEILLRGARSGDSVEAESNLAGAAGLLAEALRGPGAAVATIEVAFVAGRLPPDAARETAVRIAPGPAAPAAPAIVPPAARPPVPARAPAETPAPAGSAGVADTVSHPPAAGQPRRPDREPPTAAEMLSDARRRGTIMGEEWERDSLRAADRERRARDRAEERAAEAHLAERARAERRTRDSLEAVQRARRRSLKEARRDSLRALDRARIVERDARRAEESARRAEESARRAEESARRIARRDSALAAMRERDSLGTLARALEMLRAQERFDSLRAARPPGPRLDPRPPIGGRPPDARSSEPDAPSDEGCACRVEGTVEVRSAKPLKAPVGVAIAVHGRLALHDRVRLFMGAPREFKIVGVPCGSRLLDVLPEPGPGLAVEDVSTLGPFDCRSGALHQVRIVLRPR